MLGREEPGLKAAVVEVGGDGAEVATKEEGRWRRKTWSRPSGGVEGHMSEAER